MMLEGLVGQFAALILPSPKMTFHGAREGQLEIGCAFAPSQNPTDRAASTTLTGAGLDDLDRGVSAPMRLRAPSIPAWKREETRPSFEPQHCLGLGGSSDRLNAGPASIRAQRIDPLDPAVAGMAWNVKALGLKTSSSGENFFRAFRFTDVS